MNTTDFAALRAQITRHEGERLFPYTDTRGRLTIGVGRNLSDRGISQTESQVLLINDLSDAITGVIATYPWVATLDAPRQAVFINLAFNLGLHGLSTFTTFLKLAATGNWQGAAMDLTDTAWYTEVGQRGRDLVQQLQTGAWV